MKKTLLAFSAFLLTFTAFSQAPRAFYLAAGINQAKLESSSLPSEAGMGFQAGLGFNWGYHETHNYEINVLYNKSNFDVPNYGAFDGSTGTSKFSTETIDLMLHFNYYFIKPDEDKFYAGAQAGGFLSFNNQGWVINDSSDKRYGENFSIDSFTETAKLNAGASVGAVAGYNRVRFAIRYNFGLTNVLKNVQTQDFNDNNVYTGKVHEGKINTLSATIYYRL